MSERSVFQHFPDREELCCSRPWPARKQYERVMPTLTPVDASLALGERIDALVASAAACSGRSRACGARRC